MDFPRYVKTQTAVAEHVGLVRGTLARMWRDGKIPEKDPETGMYDLHEIARGIVQNARNVRSLSPQLQEFAKNNADVDLQRVFSARERLDLARAEQAELMVQKTKGNLVPKHEVEEFKAIVGATEQVDFQRWQSRVGPMLAKLPPERIPIELERAGREYLEQRAKSFGG